MRETGQASEGRPKTGNDNMACFLPYVLPSCPLYDATQFTGEATRFFLSVATRRYSDARRCDLINFNYFYDRQKHLC